VVSAGSSNQKWIWWRWNAGSSVIEAGATIPTDLTPDDLVLFRNVGGIGNLVFQRGLFNGESLVPASILSAAIGTGQIIESHIASRTLGPFRWGSDLRPRNHGEWNTNNSANVPTATWTRRVGFGPVNNTLSPPEGVSFASGQFTIAQRGLYLITGVLTLAAGGTGARRVRIQRVSGTAATLYLHEHPSPTTAMLTASMSIHAIIALDAADVLEIQGYQDSGAVIPWSNATEENTVSIFCLGTLP